MTWGQLAIKDGDGLLREAIGPNKLTRARFLAGGAAAAALAALAPSGSTTHAAPLFAFDVCCDGRTFRTDNGLTGPPLRGSTFIVSGKIFPGGTFARMSTHPDSPGSIGTWVCQATFLFDLAEIANGAVPHVASIEYYALNDGSLLMSEGLSGGAKSIRAVTGGAGTFNGARGMVTEEETHTNNTMIELAPGIEVPAPNFVFIFDLMS